MWWSPFRASPEPTGYPWRSIGFTLFGAAALVAAVGYAITRPAQQLISPRDLDEIEMTEFAADE